MQKPFVVHFSNFKKPPLVPKGTPYFVSLCIIYSDLFSLAVLPRVRGSIQVQLEVEVIRRRLGSFGALASPSRRASAFSQRAHLDPRLLIKLPRKPSELQTRTSGRQPGPHLGKPQEKPQGEQSRPTCPLTTRSSMT